MLNTKIEWAHHTVNFWWGCEKESEACANCYAKTVNDNPFIGKKRASWGRDGVRWMRVEAALQDLRRAQRLASRAGGIHRVFINSMSDTFESREDLNEARIALFSAVADCPSLRFLLLTKRPESIRRMVPPSWLASWPSNVWPGTTVENQRWAEQRIPSLLQVPAPTRFLSCEPLLGPLDIPKVLRSSLGYNKDGSPKVWTRPGVPMISWVICGGESGSNARPMHPDWARSLRDQCVEAASAARDPHQSVRFFFKQWGEFAPEASIVVDGSPASHTFRNNAQIHICPGGERIYRVGKHRSSRILDGQEWSQFPE